jgi:DNA-binding NtrC family response regulator
VFLRTLIAAEAGAPRDRIAGALQNVVVLARSAASDDELRKHLAGEPFDLVVLDRAWRGAGAVELIEELRELPDAPEVIVLLDEDDPRLRAKLFAAGAFGVLYRELPDDLLEQALTSLAERRLEESRARLQPIPDQDYRLSDYVTRSPAMRAVLQSTRRIAARDTTVLLLGETGVGKGLLARSLHNEGPRAAGPFVAINCGALTESLLEAELFGHERGAFTGADRARRGYFELGHRGTIFLDEIAELPLHLQVKLLQVLEERRVRPVGSEKPIDIDVRLIAATNRDLPTEVKEGRFREDLFYRLNVVTLTLPPLRERREDIAEIAESYVEHFRASMGAGARKLSEGALAALLAYHWPGNVRELANAIERAVIMSTGESISVEDLAVDIQAMSPESAVDLRFASDSSPSADWLDRPWTEVRRHVLDGAERRYLEGLLAATGGRIGETAERAGMDPRSLHQKMKKYGLRKEEFKGP